MIGIITDMNGKFSITVHDSNSKLVFSYLGYEKQVVALAGKTKLDIKTNGDGPYLGVPFEIPGKIEVEYFDKGGIGVAYHDAQTEHVGASFRADKGVDLSTTSNGYYVGWIEIGEWLRFTVDVIKEGDYDVVFQTAGGSGSIVLTFSNGDKSYTAKYAGTADWNIWRTNVKTNIHLLPGIQFLKVKCNNEQVSIDYLKIIEHEMANLLIPANLSYDAVIGTTATLRWEMSGDVSNVKNYRIYRNGQFLETSQSKSYTAKNLTAGESYDFTVSSVSLVGNESEKSNVTKVVVPNTTSADQLLHRYTVSVYPNPAKDKINIYTEGLNGENITVSLTNILGQTITFGILENNSGIFVQPVVGLPKGQYIIKIISDRVCISKTVLIQ